MKPEPHAQFEPQIVYRKRKVAHAVHHGGA